LYPFIGNFTIRILPNGLVCPANIGLYIGPVPPSLAAL
jgi:hypothetical protein